MSSHTLFLHHWLAGIPLSFFKFTFEGRQGLWNKEQLFFGFCCFVLFFTFVKLFFVYMHSLYLPLRLFLGQVHATDYSNASATGIFDTYQVCSWLVFILVCFSPEWVYLLSHNCRATFVYRCAGASSSALWCLYLYRYCPKWKIQGEWDILNSTFTGSEGGSNLMWY